MMTRTMICQRCGVEGEIEMQGADDGKPPSRLFRHLGHNPFSGHLHYQCPACGIVLLVDPMAVLAGLVSGNPRVAAGETGGAKSGKSPQVESFWLRLFQNQHSGSC